MSALLEAGGLLPGTAPADVALTSHKANTGDIQHGNAILIAGLGLVGFFFNLLLNII